MTEPLPKITFGVEIELIYIFRRAALLEYVVSHPQIETNDLSECHCFLAALLNHENPPFKGSEPSCLTATGGGFSVTHYNHWSVIDEVSIVIDHQKVADFMDMPIEYYNQHYQTQDVELISPVWHYHEAGPNTNNFTLMMNNAYSIELDQIQQTLAPDPDIGFAYINDTCGLHVHIGMPDEPTPPLGVIKQLFLLWAMCEPLIERMQAPHRRSNSNPFAQSLRASTGNLSWTQFSEKVYNASSVQGVEVLFMPEGDVDVRGLFDARNSKVILSPTTSKKSWTLEFREHGGTTDATEIAWWITFCRLMLFTAVRLDRLGTHLRGNEFADLNHLFQVIGMPESGCEFYRGKVRDYGALQELHNLGTTNDQQRSAFGELREGDQEDIQ
jgi:hypothetical protein